VAETRFIYGFHAIIAKLRHSGSDVREIFIDQTRQDARARDLIKLAQIHGVHLILSEPSRIAAMAGGAGGKQARHQGVVARVAAQVRALKLDDILDTLAEPALLLVLDGVQDPHNLGACLRVADAAGAHAVIAPKDRACGLNATAIKVASGAAESVPFIAVTNLARTLRELKERAVLTLGADAESSEELYAVEQTGPLAWVLGAEGEGLRRLTRETCDRLACIPMQGSVASLNVSVASGICLFEARRQRSLALAAGTSQG